MKQQEPGGASGGVEHYRGRLAPSPTGLLHLGHARTFWAAYRRAIEAAGTLVLRNEDLDPGRSRPEFVAAMIEDLQWLGIRWQEGFGVVSPEKSSPLGPYAQSLRYPLYRDAWERLRAGGWIYPCLCSRRRLAEASAAAGAPHEDGESDEPLYPGTCRPAPGTIAPAASPAGVAWRFQVPDGEPVAFLDGNLGPQSFVAGTAGPPAQGFGDFLVWRRDGVPAYQLAVVVDDAAMRITEVVRGADLLKSTARQVLLNRALGFSDPAWFHCALVRDEHGRRLAKRHDSLSLRALRMAGKTPGEILAMAVR